MTINKKEQLLGVYVTKNIYTDDKPFLPFIIVSYSKTNNSYNVLAIEYKGMTAYKLDIDYPEKSIIELIEDGTIIKKADPDNFSNNKEVMELISMYSKSSIQKS